MFSIIILFLITYYYYYYNYPYFLVLLMLTSILLETPSCNNSIKDKVYLIPEQDQKTEESLVRMALWEVIMILSFTSLKQTLSILYYIFTLHPA